MFAALAVVFWGLFSLFGQRTMNTVLDGYTIVGCALVIMRFGAQALAAVQKPRPLGPDILIVSIVGVSMAIGGLRMLRLFGFDLGIIDSTTVGYVFGALTTLMVYGIHLKVVAPRIRMGEKWMSPWAALLISLAGGGLLSAGLLLIDS